MDIDSLSKMVRELIPYRDEVALPGVGVFVAELVPASFSDKGYTINPPYRRLSFRQREGTDRSLVDLAVSRDGRDEAGFERELTDYLAELKDVLIERKTIIFPGLGKLRATRENHFFFVPDESLDIYPEGFGLCPLSLKFRSEGSEEDGAAVGAARAETVFAQGMSGDGSPTSGIQDAPAAELAGPSSGIQDSPSAGFGSPASDIQDTPSAGFGSPASGIQDAPAAGFGNPSSDIQDAPAARFTGPDSDSGVPEEIVSGEAAQMSAAPRHSDEATQVPAAPLRSDEAAQVSADPRRSDETAQMPASPRRSDEAAQMSAAPSHSDESAQVPASPRHSEEATQMPASPRRKMPGAFRLLLWALVTALLLLAALAVAGRVAPRLVDNILYTPEERALIWN